MPVTDWIDGRGGGIRTPDPLLPKQMRYQTALRPDCLQFIASSPQRFSNRAEHAMTVRTKQRMHHATEDPRQQKHG